MSLPMDDKALETLLRQIADDRRDKVKAGRDFTLKVMDSVRAWEAVRPAEAPRPRPSWFGNLLEKAARALDALRAPGPAVAFASLLVFAVGGLVWFQGRPMPDTVVDSTRIKGAGFRLGFLLKRDGKVEAAKPGMECRPGDLLQAVYSAPAPGRIRLYSIDASGAFSCYSCAGGDPVLPAGQERALSYALELDASAKEEWMVAFWIAGTGAVPAPASPPEELLEAAWKEAAGDPGRFEAALRTRIPQGTSLSVFPLLKDKGGRP